MPHIEAPFGDPDGSKADPGDLMSGFVEFDSPSVWGGLSLKSDDLSARVIVGRKGSGKTVYLRRLQIYANNNSSLFARTIERAVPQTRAIVKFSETFQKQRMVELWAEVWRRAIFRSLVSVFLYDQRLSANLPNKVEKKLLEGFRPITGTHTTPVTIYSQVQEIINRYTTWNQLDAFLQNPAWSDLEWEIVELIRNGSPICLYIDAMDEEFERAPKFWLDCQLGLFQQVYTLLRDENLGGRLHVIVAIRELVYAAIMQSEHRTRYLNDRYTRILNWNHDAITYFLRKKIESLDQRFFIGDYSKGRDVYTWLGLEKIRNVNRKITENIDDYLLRHTRLLPRDIVIMGNRLSNALQSNISFQKRPIDDVIRRTVSDVSAYFGGEQLKICAGQIASTTMPKFADKHNYSDFYISGEEYLDSVVRELTRLIHNSKFDRFDAASLQTLKESAHRVFGENVDVPLILWQNGLLGFTRKLKGGKLESVFLSEDRMINLELPLDQEEYVFHSCLIETGDISSKGNVPVKQFS